jgi:thioredoxin reductase (NADPH)
VTDDVTRVDFSERPFKVWVGDDLYTAEAVIVATGASARKLGVRGEQEYQGRGVTYCAVCDAAFYPDKEVVVVGGGDSAMEEAIFLTKFASKVTIVHRRDEFRASPIMVDRARANEKIEFVTNAVVEDVVGDERSITAVRLRSTVDDSTWELPVDHTYRQAVTAAGSGCMGALDAERWLSEQRGHPEAALTAPRAETAEV